LKYIKISGYPPFSTFKKVEPNQPLRKVEPKKLAPLRQSLWTFSKGGKGGF